MDTSGALVTEGSIPGFVQFGPGENAAAIVRALCYSQDLSDNLYCALLRFKSLFLAALLSTLVLSFVLLSVAWVVSSSSSKYTPHRELSREAFFFRSQLGQYATCLLFSNWIRAVSGMIDINWIKAGGVRAGEQNCLNRGSI